MGNLVSHLESSEEADEVGSKLLVMTKKFRASLAEARGMAAATLAVMMKVRPPHESGRMCAAEDRQAGGIADRGDLSLFFEALLDSVNERLSVLRKVLEAPDDNPQEAASAWAELARSKAYPGQLDGTDPSKDGPFEADGAPRASVPHEVVLPKEERWALELYQALLTSEEPGNIDRLQCEVPMMNAMDKEALRIELHAHSIYKKRLLESKAYLDTHAEMPKWSSCHLPFLSMHKGDVYSMMNAATTVQTVEVERVSMNSNRQTTGMITIPRAQPTPEHILRMWAINMEYERLKGIYESTFSTKAEKLHVLPGMIASRNGREILKARLGVGTINSSENSQRQNALVHNEGVDGENELKSTDAQIKAVSHEAEERAKSLGTDNPKRLDTEHAKSTCNEENRNPSGTNCGETPTEDGLSRSPEGLMETKPSDNEEGAKPVDEMCQESGGDVSRLDDLQRVFAPPLTQADMVSALSRLLRWREQLLSKTHGKHRAHECRRVASEVISGLKLDALADWNEVFQWIGTDKAWELSDSAVRDLVIEDMFLSGSVREATEVHICKSHPMHQTFLHSCWSSPDRRNVMSHWCTRRTVPPEKVGEAPNTYELSPKEPFKRESDVDFMLLLGPVTLDNSSLQKVSEPLQSVLNAPQSDSKPPQGDTYPLMSHCSPLQSESNSPQNDFLASNSLQSCSNPPQSGSNPLQGDSNPCKSDSKPLQGDSHPLLSDSNPMQTMSNPLQSDFSESRSPRSDPDPTQNGNNPLTSDHHQLQRTSPTQNDQIQGTNGTSRQSTFEKTSTSNQPPHGSRPDSDTDSAAHSELNVLTLLVDDAASPGFVNLRPRIQRNGRYADGDKLNFMVLHEQFRRAFSDTGLWPSVYNWYGPAIPLVVNGDNVDLVPCFTLPEWDSSEFRERKRPSRQPSQHLVDKLCHMPVYLVSSSTRYDFFTKTWRMSFSRQESAVIRSMTKPQRICLVLLKHCAAVTESYLKSQHLKTAMMWVCERRPPELWTWRGMLDSMHAVLEFLQECMENLVLPCYFCPEINLWEREKSGKHKAMLWGGKKRFDRYAVVKLRVLMPRAIQLLLAGLLSSSQAPLMRHLLGIPLDAQQFLWCCWKRSVDDPRDIRGAEFTLYPHAVEGRLWSEDFLDAFRWEKLPARCREPAWFADHGLDTDSEGEDDPVDSWETDSGAPAGTP